jgi:phytoene synthase
MLGPEVRIALGFVPARLSGNASCLFELDARLGDIVGRAREPGIALIRLVWWRDALAALDHAPPPAEPLLAAAAVLREIGIAGGPLAAMAEGWEPLLDDPDVAPETAARHACERGARLFGLVGRALGMDDDRLSSAGEGWALADLGRRFVPRARADALFDLARAPLERAMATRWPAKLRPLGMLTALALQDARRGADALPTPASPPRLVRLLAHRWTGY